MHDYEESAKSKTIFLLCIKTCMHNVFSLKEKCIGFYLCLSCLLDKNGIKLTDGTSFFQTNNRSNITTAKSFLSVHS